MIESRVTLTWYPGAVGATDDPLILLSPSHHVEEPGTLSGLGEQLVDAVDTVRGASRVHHARGNVANRLEWTELRRIADPMTAAETGLTLQAGLPTETGWLLVELEGRGTTWSLDSAVIRGIEWANEDRRGVLKIRWRVDAGALAAYEGGESVTVYAPGELMEGPATNRGAILLGPNRTYPAP